MRVVVLVCFVVLVVQLLVPPDRAAREVQGDGGEQPPADAAAARAARRDLRSPRAACSSRTATRSTSRFCASTARISIARSGCCRTVTQVPEAQIREIVARHRREPAYRPIVVIHDATLPQVAAVAARRLELPDVVVQEVPTRQYPSEALAAHLFGYVGEASEEQVSDGRLPARHHRRADRRREDLQHDADGPGRRAPRRRQQHGPRDAHSSKRFRRSKAAACSSRSTVDAEGGRGRVSSTSATRARRSCSIRTDRRGADASSACRPTIRTRSPAASIARRGRRSSPTSCGRCRIARFRAGTRRDRPSSSSSRRRRSKKGWSRPTSACIAAAAPTFYGRYFQCHLKGGHGSVDCGTRSRSRATCTSTRSATCSASIAFTSGR